jgi:CTP:molybdopterin cytidylyltransferase MocA
MKDWLIAHLPDPILTAVFAVVGWWMQRKVARSEALEARVAALEQQRVTKDDFDELRESMNATFTNGIERVERRTDEILLHLAQRDAR